MPRVTGNVVNNNFLKGLITEATPFDYPTGACTETFDCVHEITGAIDRRPGFEYEINKSFKSIDSTNSVITTYLWKDVAGNGNLVFVVLQVGTHLYFYDGSTTDPLSGHPFTSNINLALYSSSGAPTPATLECQFATGNGKLFVAHPYLETFYVTFDTNTKIFTSTQITLNIRDTVGLTDDPHAVDERPLLNWSSLDTSHKYNLLNQGWSQTNINLWDAARGDLPSNADVMWAFKNATDDFDVTLIDKIAAVAGNTPAPKGHFVLNAYDQDRGMATGLGIPHKTTGYFRASAIAFFQGRMFYSGITTADFNGNIYFSQIVEDDTQYGKCYQSNDPTAQDLFDLVSSDGGVIRIQEAGMIHKLFPVIGGLAVFASNGVWMVTGSTGLGFTATDYTVAKIASISTLTHTSFVDAAGTPMWWNLEGIYKMSTQSGSYTVTPITNNTIATFYDDIPPSEKRNARGFYNPLQYKIQWLFKTTESASLADFYHFDRILNLDIRTGAFYPWTIPSTSQNRIHGLVILENRGGDASLENVTDNALAQIYMADGITPVQVWTIGNSIVIPSFKYVASLNLSQFSFAETLDETNWKDWALDNPIDYTSYFITGYVMPNPMTNFESNFINFYSANDSKFYIQGKWDFSVSGESGRYSTPQLVDATVANNSSKYSDIVSRRKLRGHGKAMQIKVSSSSGSPFKLDGWGMFVSANQMP